MSHWSTAVTPDELMEPSYTGANHDPGLATFMMLDMGWPMDASVDMAFQEVAAAEHEGAVTVTWSFGADEVFDGFRVYRRDQAGGDEELVSGLLATTARSYTDNGVLPGKAYRETVDAEIVIPDDALELASAHGPMTGIDPKKLR